MAKQSKPLGNKRQRERDKARKKRDKEARREARKNGEPEPDGETSDGDEEQATVEQDQVSEPHPDQQS